MRYSGVWVELQSLIDKPYRRFVVSSSILDQAEKMVRIEVVRRLLGDRSEKGFGTCQLPFLIKCQSLLNRGRDFGGLRRLLELVDPTTPLALAHLLDDPAFPKYRKLNSSIVGEHAEAIRRYL